MNRECVLNSKSGTFPSGLSLVITVKNQPFSMGVSELMRRILAKWKVCRAWFEPRRDAKRNSSSNQMASAYYLHNLP